MTDPHDGQADDRWMRFPVATPGMVLDLDIFDANMRELAEIARSAGVQLLPHAKTHRMAEAGLRQIENGAHGLCVAKLGEAESFAEAGIRHLFVANPVMGDDKLARALRLSRETDLVLATDSVEAAQAAGAAFSPGSDPVKMMLGIDSGLHREGVRPSDAVAMARDIAVIDGVDLVGIYTHEGSTYGARDRDDLDRQAAQAARLMVEIAEAIRATGIALPVVSLGASASARSVARIPGVTQIRPGIFAFNDASQIALGNATLATAAVRIMATVTSHPEPDRACIDAGSKTLSADLLLASAHRDEYPGHGMLVNAPGWVLERVSEEHGWLRWRGRGAPTALPVGMRVEIVPNHVCMPFALLRKATVVSGDRIVGTWEGFGPGASE